MSHSIIIGKTYSVKLVYQSRFKTALKKACIGFTYIWNRYKRLYSHFANA